MVSHRSGTTFSARSCTWKSVFHTRESVAEGNILRWHGQIPEHYTQEVKHLLNEVSYQHTNGSWHMKRARNSRSLNTALSVLLWRSDRFYRRVIIFCGGSFRANRGLRLGRTREANWVDERLCEMTKTFGRMYGRRNVSFICKFLWTGKCKNKINVTYLFHERRENFPCLEALGESIEDTSQAFHEGDLLFSSLRSECWPFQEVQRWYWKRWEKWVCWQGRRRRSIYGVPRN